MTFSDFQLDARLQTGVQHMGFEVPTAIQTSALPIALAGHDVLGSAETGTGKTAAYLLPIMNRLLAAGGRSRQPRALVLAPTRELALQVAEHAVQLSRFTDLRSVAIYGGAALGQQETQLRRGADIVIATPGRLLDHLERHNVAFGALEVLVLDEADRMLDVGFLPDIRRIVRTLPRERQTMLFSATLTAPIVRLAAEVTRDPRRVQVEQTATPRSIAQAFYTVVEHQKAQLLQSLLRDEAMESVLVFARTKHRADRIVKQLRGAEIRAAVMHGNRSQSQRVAALEAFRVGHARVLVATDIAARGIDVEGVSHVVNYDMPMQMEDYVHRIGRTGRMQAVGCAYSMVTPEDLTMAHRIEGMLQQRIERRRPEGLGAVEVVKPQPRAAVGAPARWGDRKRRFSVRRGA